MLGGIGHLRTLPAGRVPAWQQPRRGLSVFPSSQPPALAQTGGFLPHWGPAVSQLQSTGGAGTCGGVKRREVWGEPSSCPLVLLSGAVGEGGSGLEEVEEDDPRGSGAGRWLLSLVVTKRSTEPQWCGERHMLAVTSMLGLRPRCAEGIRGV